MWWRLKHSEFEKQKGEANRLAMKQIVDSRKVPGTLAYLEGEPVGWCSVAPRESFPRLERSRTLKRIDDQPVWSVVCFFIARPYRRPGVSVKLLQAAIHYVAAQGGNIVEGYPVEPKNGQTPGAFAWTGLASAFRKAGFREVHRPSPTRPIFRYLITSQDAP